MKRKTKTIALYGLLTTLAFMLSYLESMVPLPFFIPGMKLGLANLVVLTALYRMGIRAAAVLSCVRVLLAALIFGSAFSLLYSAAGAACSFLVMVLLKKAEKFTTVGVSIAGGICHNLGQILMAVFLLKTEQLLYYYFPVLLISGCVSGVLIGLLGNELVRRVPIGGGIFS